MIRDAIVQIAAGGKLSVEDAAGVLEDIMTGIATP
jgi:hypothetical protein